MNRAPSARVWEGEEGAGGFDHGRGSGARLPGARRDAPTLLRAHTVPDPLDIRAFGQYRGGARGPGARPGPHAGLSAGGHTGAPPTWPLRRMASPPPAGFLPKLGPTPHHTLQTARASRAHGAARGPGGAPARGDASRKLLLFGQVCGSASDRPVSCLPGRSGPRGRGAAPSAGRRAGLTPAAARPGLSSGSGDGAAAGQGCRPQQGPRCVSPASGSGPGPREQTLSHISTAPRRAGHREAGAGASGRKAVGSEFPGWEAGPEGEGGLPGPRGAGLAGPGRAAGVRLGGGTGPEPSAPPTCPHRAAPPHRGWSGAPALGVAPPVLPPRLKAAPQLASFLLNLPPWPDRAGLDTTPQTPEGPRAVVGEGWMEARRTGLGRCLCPPGAPPSVLKAQALCLPNDQEPQLSLPPRGPPQAVLGPQQVDTSQDSRAQLPQQNDEGPRQGWWRDRHPPRVRGISGPASPAASPPQGSPCRRDPWRVWLLGTCGASRAADGERWAGAPGQREASRPLEATGCASPSAPAPPPLTQAANGADEGQAPPDPARPSPGAQAFCGSRSPSRGLALLDGPPERAREAAAPAAPEEALQARCWRASGEGPPAPRGVLPGCPPVSVIYTPSRDPEQTWTRSLKPPHVLLGGPHPGQPCRGWARRKHGCFPARRWPPLEPTSDGRVTLGLGAAHTPGALDSFRHARLGPRGAMTPEPGCPCWDLENPERRGQQSPNGSSNAPDMSTDPAAHVF
ncbi:collagen alpha-1(III) chain-like [Hippopotamus amphibius kiboko]|uniref:collagen alpha-1(III) chain-like n=1 Tax=Hippopotamus amphibius kiboko TaxID=575201 RepID=UPI002593BC6A|nr:collagen alpha-1(III) chain-like [Hippopotamus amphibius kiboko]